MQRKYDLSKLTEEEKEQLKDYVNAIKETKKAAEELLEKAATEPKNEGSWGGPRKNMVMRIKEASNPEGDKMVMNFLKKVAREFDHGIPEAAAFVKDTIKKLGY